MSKNKSKRSYFLEEEITVELNTVLSVKIRDLGIHPECMSNSKVKRLIADYVDSLLRESSSIVPVAYKVSDTINASSKSQLYDVTHKDKDSK